jgi:hypothetical protein
VNEYAALAARAAYAREGHGEGTLLALVPISGRSAANVIEFPLHRMSRCGPRISGRLRNEVFDTNEQ